MNMGEKAKNVNMFGKDLNLDTYFDEEEEKNVRSVQREWDGINKYCFITTFGEDKAKEQEAFIKEMRELLYSLRDRIRAYRKDALSIKAIEEYNEVLHEVNYELGEDDQEPEFVIDMEYLKKAKEDKRIRELQMDIQMDIKVLAYKRQKILDSIQEEENLIAKLKERNASPSVIADEQAIIDNSKKEIEDLDKENDALNEQLNKIK